ncbi:MAG: co-chaperone GroES [Pyrinomonadaceae bacterium]|nr:co-chaperone GroES [Pyrinomonadaceae bacterium]
MATTIKPLHDRVIIRRIDDASDKTAGGLFIPDTAKEKPQEGEVIAVGEGKYRKDGTRQALDVKAGDRVLFGKYSSSEIKIDGEELLIMREDEILGIIMRAGVASGSAGSSSATSGSGKKSGK